MKLKSLIKFRPRADPLHFRPNPERDWARLLSGWLAITILLFAAGEVGFRRVARLEREVTAQVTAESALNLSEAKIKAAAARVIERAAARAAIDLRP